MFDPRAPTDVLKNVKLLIRAVRGNEDGYGLTDNLGEARRNPINAALMPALPAVQQRQLFWPEPVGRHRIHDDSP
jgi:hypothetical protein